MKVKEILKHQSARDFYHEKIKNIGADLWDSGHPQDVMTRNSKNKIKSEANNENHLKLKNENLFLKSLPFRVVIYTKKQLQVIIEDKNPKIAHMDSTSAVISKPCDCSRIDYYCIVCRLIESVMPAAEMITCEHNENSISTFLKYFKHFMRKEFNVWPLFTAIVTSWSWASMKALFFEWNEILLQAYLDLAYKYVTGGGKPTKITILLTCILTELDTIYDEFACLLLSKDAQKVENSILILSGWMIAEKQTQLDELSKEFMMIDKIKKELKAESEFYIFYEESKALYVLFYFFKRYYEKCIATENTLQDEESIIMDEDITNPFQSSEFL